MSKKRWLEVALRAAEFRNITAQHEMRLARHAHTLAADEMQQAKQTAESWLAAWQGRRRAADFSSDTVYRHVTAHADEIVDGKQLAAEARKLELDRVVIRLRESHSHQQALSELSENLALRDAQRDRARQLSDATESWMLGRFAQDHSRQ